MLPPGAIFKLKIHQNAYAAGASPQTPLGKLTELPDPLAGFQGALRDRGGEERGGEGEGGKMEKGKGSVPTYFSQFNDYSLLSNDSCSDISPTRSLDFIAFQFVCSSVCRHYAD